MDLTVGMKFHGFTVTRIRPIPGENTDLVELVFDKTATPVCWYKNNDESKLFCIAFKTLPDDSTGVYHILEHSVLCGSDEYNVKDPFVELLKSSMSTFLNAMTSQDKTYYPVGSRNTQDFLNLTKIYLSCTLSPALLKNPNVFYQEGWHLETLNGEPRYNGVVYNEMKGATADAGDVISRGANAALFPDNAYGFNSGGDPVCIPDLSYEKFVRCYKENYHPTNARIYLDGDIPVDETFGLIESYLNRYEMGTARGNTYQTPCSREITAYYDCPDAGVGSKASFALAKIVGRWDELVKNYAISVITDVIAGSNSAPLKKAILSAGLGQDVSFMYNSKTLQPWYCLAVKNTSEDKFDAIKEAVRAAVEKILAEGFNKDELIASINRMSFTLRDMREPKAIARCRNIFGSWLYDGDPMDHLYIDDTIEELRRMAEGDGFENLLREMFDDENICTVRVLPSATYSAELRDSVNARIKAEMDAWTDEDREANRSLCENLAAWQKKDNTPEELACLPVLDIKEISDTPSSLNTTESVVDGVTVYHNNVASKGIVHFNLRFNLAGMSQDDLTTFAFTSELLGKLPTRNYDAAALQAALKKYVGYLNFSLDATAKVGETDKCTPWLVVSAGVLRESLENAQDIIAEILTATNFDNADLILSILRQTNQMRTRIGITGGDSIGTLAALSHYSAAGAVKEAVSGHTYTLSLSKFSAEFDARIGDFVRLAKDTMAAAVCKENLYISATHNTDGDAGRIVTLIPNGTAAPAAAAYTTTLPKNYGIAVPGQSSYACAGYHLKESGEEYNGTLCLLEKLFSYGYLWNNIRVQGGAYGCSLVLSETGDVVFTSFRDPSPANSLNVYKGAADFLRGFVESNDRLDKYIIGAVAASDPLKNLRILAAADDIHRLSGLTYEDKVKVRRALLNATHEDIARWIPMFEMAAENFAVAVVAPKDKLATCGDLVIADL